ncbi:hypothetical protein PRBEI_2000613900 [Prionailurus iriomotensis]
MFRKVVESDLNSPGFMVLCRICALTLRDIGLLQKNETNNNALLKAAHVYLKLNYPGWFAQIRRWRGGLYSDRRKKKKNQGLITVPYKSTCVEGTLCRSRRNTGDH